MPDQVEHKVDDFAPITDVEIQIVDEEGKALDNRTLRVETGGSSQELTTDGEGKVRIPVAGEANVALVGEANGEATESDANE